jgi:hypothetical protein
VHKLLFSGKTFAVEEFRVYTLGAEGIVSWLLLTVTKASQSTANKLCLISDNSQIFLLSCVFSAKLSLLLIFILTISIAGTTR